MQKVLLQKHPAAGLALQQDQGELRDLLPGIHVVEVTVVAAARHKDGVGGEAGPGMQRGGVRGGGGEGDVHSAGFQHAQHLGAAAADNLQPDARVLAVEGLQIWRQEKAGDSVAGADSQGAQQQLLGLGQLVLPCGQQAQGAADILVEHLPLPGEGDAPGTAGEQAGLERRLQLLDRLAHRRLGDVEVFCRQGDVARLRHLFEHSVQLQLDRHGSSLQQSEFLIVSGIIIRDDWRKRNGGGKIFGFSLQAGWFLVY